jgi:hypothetical protein
MAEEPYIDDFNGEDIGGIYSDIHDAEEAYDRMQMIKADRKQRVRKLSGKYVIVADGWKSKKKVFLQDPRISDKGHWTQFLSNAMGMGNKEANDLAKKFKYNNPRVAIVTAEGIYKFL